MLLIISTSWITFSFKSLGCTYEMTMMSWHLGLGRHNPNYHTKLHVTWYGGVGNKVIWEDRLLPVIFQEVLILVDIKKARNLCEDKAIVKSPQIFLHVSIYIMSLNYSLLTFPSWGNDANLTKDTINAKL